MTDFDAVTLTDKEKIIAHVGESTMRHDIGKPIVTDITKFVLKCGQSKCLDSCDEKECNYTDVCRLKSILTLPLSNGEIIVGTLKLYKKTASSITELDVELGEGLAKLISTELKISKLERKEKLLKEAEYRALQSQINPHFLFNSLNSIYALSLKKSDLTPDLILKLSDILRYLLYEGSEKKVSLSQEVKYLKSYMELEKVAKGMK